MEAYHVLSASMNDTSNSSWGQNHDELNASSHDSSSSFVCGSASKTSSTFISTVMSKSTSTSASIPKANITHKSTKSEMSIKEDCEKTVSTNDMNIIVTVNEREQSTTEEEIDVECFGCGEDVSITDIFRYGCKEKHFICTACARGRMFADIKRKKRPCCPVGTFIYSFLFIFNELVSNFLGTIEC